MRRCWSQRLGSQRLGSQRLGARPPGVRRFGVWLVAGACVIAPLLAGCAGRERGPAAGIGDAAAPDPGSAAPGTGTGSLRGMTLAQLTVRLGAASFRRSDGPTELLQYRSPVCVLDVFVYHDAAGDGGRVEHVEARDHALAAMAEDACVRTLAPSSQSGRG